jgi:hypothetical protein
MKQPDDDGLTRIQRLSPEHFDVVLGAHPGKRKAADTPAPRSFARLAVFLTVLGTIAYLLTTHFHTRKPTVTTPLAPAVFSEPIAVTVAPAQAQPSVAPEPTLGIVSPRPAPPPPQHSSQAPAPQGMVSANYLADFKSDSQHSNTPQQKSRAVIVTASIREWDGRNRYRAQWRLFNNLIEGNSVCFNFPSTSIEHRECRKAAQVFFKEECREWTKRWNNDREEQSKSTEQRYCEAAKSFNPAG